MYRSRSQPPTTEADHQGFPDERAPRPELRALISIWTEVIVDDLTRDPARNKEELK